MYRRMSAMFRNWLRDLPSRIKSQRTDLEKRAQLIREAMGHGYSADYRWFRLREAIGLLADDE